MIESVSSFRVESTIPCLAVHLVDIWKESFKEGRRLTVRDSNKKINLDVFANNIENDSLLEIIILMIDSYSQFKDLDIAFVTAINQMPFNHGLVNILEQVSGKSWSILDPDSVQNGKPTFDLEPYSKLWDIYGIGYIDDFIHVGLYYRSASLRDSKYLPLADFREPKVLEYANFKPTVADIELYQKLIKDITNNNKTIIYHTSFAGAESSSLKDFLIKSINIVIG